MPRFEKESDPRTFLADLKHTVSAYVGDQAFTLQCGRYLKYLTKSEFHRQALDKEYEKKGSKDGYNISWDDCETIFLKVSMTEQERIGKIQQLCAAGRESNESYREFAMRIDRDIRVYGIKDDNEMVLSLLASLVKPTTLDTMQLTLRLEKNDANAEFTSVCDFIRIMGGMNGPQSVLRKNTNGSVHDSSPRALRNKRNKNIRFNPTGGNGNQSSGSSNQNIDDQNLSAGNHRSNGDQRRPSFFNDARQQYNCNHCGKNYTHDTARHIVCTKCQLRGHSAENCRSGGYRCPQPQQW